MGSKKKSLANRGYEQTFSGNFLVGHDSLSPTSSFLAIMAWKCKKPTFESALSVIWADLHANPKNSLIEHKKAQKQKLKMSGNKNSYK